MPSRGEFDEFHLEHYRAGQIYVLPARLASLLILAGYAELVEDRRALGRRWTPTTAEAEMNSAS